MEFTPRCAVLAPKPATLRPIIERPVVANDTDDDDDDDDASMESVEDGDDGGVVDPRGDSYVQMTLEGKATRQCALFPFCLHDVSICKGVMRRSCLFFMDKEPPSRVEVAAETARFNTTKSGLELIEFKRKKKAEQRQQRTHQKRKDKRQRESTT